MTDLTAVGPSTHEPVPCGCLLGPGFVARGLRFVFNFASSRRLTDLIGPIWQSQQTSNLLSELFSDLEAMQNSKQTIVQVEMTFAIIKQLKQLL